MTHSCLNCGATIPDNTAQWELTDRRKGLAGTWQLAECRNCGVISMVPMPTDEQLAAYYSAYSPDEKIDLLPRRGSRYPLLRKLYHYLSGDVDPRDFVQVPQGARVLDYGCGLAGYLADFHQRGIAISGAEIAGFVVDACRRSGFDVHKVNDFSRIPFADNEFDIVYLMQVFEHLRDPHAFMQELARILKSGGTLYIAVPNSASVWRKIFGKSWVSGWFAPFHLFHYNSKALSALAAQHGFETLHSWSRTPESWFRLNVKAWIYPDENRLDERHTFIDTIWARIPLMLILRIMEWFIPQRDCLVAKLIKRQIRMPANGGNIRLAVLMACHNRVSHTVDCLAALKNQQPFGAKMDLFLVDDGSSDGTASAVTNIFPDAVIIRGDGNLYWCGGMRLAFAHAMQKGYDFYLWLNDDTQLDEDAFLRIFQTRSEAASQLGDSLIIVGSTYDRESGNVSYGGWQQCRGKFGSISWEKIPPQAEHWIRCDTMNGNCVLIPDVVAKSIGNIDAGFTHSMGDLDYGLRAKKAGCQIVIAPGYYGGCNANDGADLWTDARLPLLVRWKKLLGPKGLPVKEWMIFCRRHKGRLWIIVWLSPYLMFWVNALLHKLGIKP